MATTYKKISDTEFEETEEISDVKKTTYSIESLLEKKANLIEQSKRQTEELNNQITKTKSDLAEIDVLITKAKELGITEI